MWYPTSTTLGRREVRPVDARLLASYVHPANHIGLDDRSVNQDRGMSPDALAAPRGIILGNDRLAISEMRPTIPTMMAVDGASSSPCRRPG